MMTNKSISRIPQLTNFMLIHYSKITTWNQINELLWLWVLDQLRSCADETALKLGIALLGWLNYYFLLADGAGFLFHEPVPDAVAVVRVVTFQHCHPLLLLDFVITNAASKNNDVITFPSRDLNCTSKCAGPVSKHPRKSVPCSLTLFAIPSVAAPRRSFRWAPGRSSRRGWHSGLLFDCRVPSAGYSFSPCTMWAHSAVPLFHCRVRRACWSASPACPCPRRLWLRWLVFPKFAQMYNLNFRFLSKSLLP